MELKKLRLHPLFLLVGLLSAIFGQLPVFLTVTLAALEHECAHALAAGRLGFCLDKIVLMPYGAVIGGDLSGITKKQELWVLLAGPLANGLTALGFAALWWLFPETYPYTDTAAIVSLSLFLVNLFPAYPLDGGRILKIFLSPLGERRAKIICRVVSICFAAGIFVLFIASCFGEPNFGALFFSAMLFAGSFGGGEYGYLPIKKKNFSRGIEERRIALSGECLARAAMRFLREDRYTVFILFDKEEYLGELPEEEFVARLAEGKYEEELQSFL